MLVLALAFLYFVFIFGLISVPLQKHQQIVFSNDTAAFAVVMNVLEAAAVFVLWRSTDLNSGIALIFAIVLWSSELVYITNSFQLAGNTFTLTTRRGMASMLMSAAGLVMVSIMALA